jgi:hypothetical protein
LSSSAQSTKPGQVRLWRSASALGIAADRVRSGCAACRDLVTRLTATSPPWSCPAELERLRRCYLSPLDALDRIDDDLAAAFAYARWCLTSGEATTPEELAVFAERLAEEVMRWPR